MDGTSSDGQHDGGPTMQLDAVADSLEDYDPTVGPQALSAPPPLPPKKAGTGMWVVGGLVVLVAAGAALAIGLYMMTGAAASPAPEAATTETEDEPAAEEPETAPEAAEADAVEATAEEADPVVMDEFVFEHDGEEE